MRLMVVTSFSRFLRGTLSSENINIVLYFSFHCFFSLLYSLIPLLVEQDIQTLLDLGENIGALSSQVLLVYYPLLDSLA